MKKLALIITLGSLIFWPHRVKAELNVYAVISECERTTAACYMFLYGADTVAAVSRTQQICGRGVISYEQARLVLLNYLRQHPEKLNLPMGVLFLEAMYSAFPCNQEK